jgi:hypothetical protein
MKGNLGRISIWGWGGTIAGSKSTVPRNQAMFGRIPVRPKLETSLIRRKLKIAYSLQVGLNYFFDNGLSFGAGASYYYLGSGTYPATPAGNGIGIDGVSGPIAGVSFVANMNLRFGPRQFYPR